MAKALLLLFLALPAFAQDRTQAIANMKYHCDCVMGGGVCRVENDPRPPRSGVKFTSAGPISADVYNAIKQDGALMCVKGAEACLTWDGEKCKGFRLMFRQEKMVCR